MVAVVFHDKATRLVADRGGVSVGLGIGTVHRLAAIFGARELADRALFHLGQLCRDTQPVYCQAERSIQNERSLTGQGFGVAGRDKLPEPALLRQHLLGTKAHRAGLCVVIRQPVHQCRTILNRWQAG